MSAGDRERDTNSSEVAVDSSDLGAEATTNRREALVSVVRVAGAALPVIVTLGAREARATGSWGDGGRRRRKSGDDQQEQQSGQSQTRDRQTYRSGGTRPFDRW